MAVNIPNFIFDFDSTLIPFETLDELAKISTAQQPNSDAIIQEIHAITQQAMNGNLSFHESLKQRLTLLKPTRAHLAQITSQFLTHLTPSISRNKKFFKEFAAKSFLNEGIW